MVSPGMIKFARKAEEVYYSRFQEFLEPEHLDEFVAIEPESGDYFLGKTLSEAIGVWPVTFRPGSHMPCVSGTRQRFILGCIL